MASWIKAEKEDKDQLAMGIKIEVEHAPTIEKIRASVKDGVISMTDEEIYASIAGDHISEFPNGSYYSELEKLEKKLKSEHKNDSSTDKLDDAMTTEEKELLK